ncbi:MAG: hypothetical protein KAW41_00170 [Candidatus Diapherotrites archaeon]|nr:hypothetical protein [Candidatus Diapherotrites archaeon]
MGNKFVYAGIAFLAVAILLAGCTSNTAPLKPILPAQTGDFAYEITVENIVGSFNYTPSYTQSELILALGEDALFDASFPDAVILAPPSISGSAMLFASGTVILTGYKSSESVYAAATEVTALLQSKGLEATPEGPAKVKNIVASINLNKTLDIPALHQKLGGQYEPDEFPALALSNYVPGSTVTFLVFPNGKIISSGVTTEGLLPVTFDYVVMQIES